MNDKFAGQLRQHLLTAADERPADGQLAALVQAVSVTAQRRPLAARLRFPGRVGAYQSTAVRFGLVAVLLTLSAVVGAMLIGNAPRTPSTVFEGTWTSIDPADGSAMTLAVSEGYYPAIRFVDQYAAGAACVNDAVKVFTADGNGTIVGRRLAVAFPRGGGCGLQSVEVGPGTYTYDQASDTITDDQQLTWHRVRSAAALPTRDPLSEPTAGPVPSPDLDPYCRDMPAGSTYRNDVGPLSLTVTIPTAAQFGWQGLREDFSVSNYCWFGGPVVIHASIVTTVSASCETDDTVEIGRPAEAVAALAGAPGFAISEPTRLTLGGYPATRFEVAADARMCFDEVRLWNDTTITRGKTSIIYLVDVDGLALGITIESGDTEPPALMGPEAEAIVATLQVGAATKPQPSNAPAPTRDAACIQFRGTGTYTAPVGPLSVSATLPKDADTYWHGLRDSFYLLRSPCLFGASLAFEGSIVTQVYPDACHWFGTGTEVADATAAAAALAEQAGSDATEPTELTIDGYRALRLKVSIPDDADSESCASGGFMLWQTGAGTYEGIGPGLVWTVWLVDVEGSILAITDSHNVSDEIDDPALLRQIDEIVGSLQVKTQGGGS